MLAHAGYIYSSMIIRSKATGMSVDSRTLETYNPILLGKGIPLPLEAPPLSSSIGMDCDDFALNELFQRSTKQGR